MYQFITNQCVGFLPKLLTEDNEESQLDEDE